jgi:hypothetical protein
VQVIDRGAQAVARGGVRCASQVLGRGQKCVSAAACELGTRYYCAATAAAVGLLGRGPGRQYTSALQIAERRCLCRCRGRGCGGGRDGQGALELSALPLPARKPRCRRG